MKITQSTAKKFINEAIKNIKEEVKNKKVLLALSGGVDSSVVAVLLSKAIGKQLICIHVDSGLMRIDESREVVKTFKNNFGINIKFIQASKIFLEKLKGVSNSEKKRKIIGKTFINVFLKEAKKENIEFLAQGTIYPDILESEKNIKAHHNVGGLPKNIKFKLIEPLKYLYKNDVRIIGKELGIPNIILERQPFPGPGLGVRCLGKIDLCRLKILKKSDKILRDTFKKYGLEKSVWQFFTIISDVKRIGVINNKRFLGFVIIIRAVSSIDAMTAKSYEVPYKVLNEVVSHITKLHSVSRVVYDLTPKPCGTIEWE